MEPEMAIALSVVIIITRVRGIKQWCVSDICLSVTYIGPKLRTERPRKTKIGAEVAHVTRDSGHQFPGKRVNGQLAGAGHIVVASRTASLYSYRPIQSLKL